VLEATSEALGCDYALLYLVDDSRRTAGVAAGVGRPRGEESGEEARLPLAGSHPAVSSLREGRMRIVRGTDERPDGVDGERFEQRRYTRVFLPLRAASEDLGTLELGYAAGARARLGEESKRTFAAFADQVAIAVHNMQLLRRTDEALARKMAELAVGQEIQLSLLPKSCPQVPGWEIDAFYRPAELVGGDFYDVFDLPNRPGHLGLVVADVTDKGVPAALFMALSRTIIRSTAFGRRGPAAALKRANELILSDSQAGLFLTAFYAVLDTASGRLAYACAGHDRPLWWHAAGGRVQELAARGLPLGALAGVDLEERTVRLARGDVLLLYTDGVTDAMDSRAELFGRERLAAALAAAPHDAAHQVVAAVRAAVTAFSGSGRPSDDLTLLAVKYL